MTTLHVLVPDGIDDPRRPSGGNVYDRRVSVELAGAGWEVVEHAVGGDWPDPGYAALARLSAVLVALPDQAVVLVDGLIGSVAPDVLVPAAARLRMFVLVHLPRFDDDERAVLTAATGILATSSWTRRRLVAAYAVPADRISVAEPGVDPAGLAAGSAGGQRLLCVAAVAHHKGHDLLLEALRQVVELPWHCRWVGPIDREPDFVGALAAGIERDGLAGRVGFSGPLAGPDLDRAYTAADLLVLASRGETYGMVVAEALARGVPVVATAVGGLPATLGRTPVGPPGLLVRPEDPSALAAALRDWLTRPELREQLKTAAELRRVTLTGWGVTAERIAHALTAPTDWRGAA